MKLILTILVISFQTCCLYAQQINIRNYSIEDGLVNNDVLRIRQDSRGFLWLCTRGGLSRYDGIRFVNYTTNNGLTNDMINDIVEIAPQQFIVGQNLGGPCLLENDRIKPRKQNNHVTLNRFYKIAGNRLLASTDQYGAMEWKGDSFYPVNSSYNKSLEDMAMMNDSLWAVIQANSFVQVVTSRFAAYSDASVLNVSTIHTDSRHRTWLGTTTGLKLLDTIQERNKPVRFIPLPPAFDLPSFRNTWITNFLEDSKGNCWVATTGKGVVRISPDGRATIYSEADGLPSSFINCIWEDYEKNIWVGTPLGLAKFSVSNEVKIFTPKHGLTKGATGCILPTAGNNVQLYDAQTITELNLATDSFHLVASEGKSDAILYKVGKEELLLTGKDGNKLYTRNKEQPEKIPWPAIGKSYLITHMENGSFAALVNNNLYTISNGRIRGKLILKPNLLVYSMIPDKKGNLWLGTFENGVYKINFQSVKDSVYMELGDSVRNELPDQNIRTLFCDRENELWIGTRYKGLFRFLQNANGKYDMQHYGVEQGLSSNFIRTINRDNKGNIWVGTPQGLDKLIAVQEKYRIFNFGKINNIYHLVQDMCFLNDDYFVTEGLVLIHARDLQQDTLSPPPVYITRAAIGPMAADSAIDPVSTLSYRKPQIYFEFCAPQFINEEWNEYSYRLLGGSDTNWIKAGSSRSVYFASLRPGNYTFEVKVLGFNGEWGTPAKYNFIVTTPFWQKWWFIALMVAAVAMLGYALYRYRIRQLIRLQQVRNQIATDLHDEIGSNLTNISILTSLSKKNIDQPQEATNFLQRISEEVASSSQSLDDIIWSVNVNHDTLEETVARMRLYAAELFDGGDIRYDLQLDPAFEKTKLIMEQRRDIYLIYKEAVNNILKHARAKNVLIKIAMIPGHQLELYIKDDGIGFDTNKISHRHGLEGMRSRVKKWKGKIQIDSEANGGTSLDIILPLD